jgi:uncharacterized membrane protein
MSRKAALVIGVVLVLVSVGMSLWAYPSLPERVPTHWDLGGHVNGYSSRIVAVSLMPIVIAFTWVLMLVLPVISPRGFRFDQSADAYYESLLAVIAVLVVLHFIVLRAQLGLSAPPNTQFFIPIGILLVILGNLMGKFRKNFFIGVRTPWTLASDEVWLRTNRLGGRLSVIGGLALIVCSFFSAAAAPALVVIVAIVALIPVMYSYFLYKRIEGFGPNSQET